MADIYAFPTGESNDGRPVRPQGVPDEVWAAVESVSTMKRIHDVRYREIPVPSTLADYGIGVEFEAGERALFRRSWQRCRITNRHRLDHDALCS